MLHAIELVLFAGLVLGGIGMVIVDPIGYFSKLRPILFPSKGLFTPPQAAQVPPSNVPTVASWHLVRDTSAQKYGAANVKGVFQGSGGPVAFSDDSKEMFIITQEGISGLVKVAVTSSGMVFTGYSIDSIFFDGVYPYNNPRAIGQKSGFVFQSCSTGANFCQAINASTTPPRGLWSASQGGGLPSHACNTDGVWGFCMVDTNPGTILIFNLATPKQSGGQVVPSFVVTASDDWTNPGSYWCYLDTANKRMAVGSNVPKTYLIDYSNLYLGTPATPTIVSTLAETFGYPAGNRLYCVSGLVVHTYNITVPSAPSLIGGSSTYTGTISNGTSYGLMQYDNTNHLLYLPWGGSPGGAGTDILNINTGTDALTKNQTLPSYTFADGTVMPIVFATLSPDNTKYAINTSYPFQGGGSLPGVTSVWDVTSVHSGVSPTSTFQVPVQAEPRGAVLSDADTQQYIYNTTRYNIEVSDATDTLVGATWIANGFPTQMRRIGVTGGTDPDGKAGPCTSNNYFLMPAGGDVTDFDFIVHCQGGAAVVTYTQNATFSDAYWDGKYLWAALNNVGHNGTPTIGLYTVSFSTSATPNTWTFNEVVQWNGAHFVGTPFQSVTLCPGTSFDSNNALALLQCACDTTVGGSVLQYAGGHLVKFQTIAGVPTATEITPGIFGTGQFGGDPIIIQFSDLNSTASFNVQGGGSMNAPATVWFQLAYFDVTETVLLGITAIPAGGASNGINISSSGSEVVITNLPTPPAGSGFILVGGASKFGTGQTFNQATDSFADIVIVSSSVTSITITQAQSSWSGNMPQPGNPVKTAGNFMNSVPEATNGIVYCAVGDTFGVRGYKNLTTTPSLACEFTQTGDATVPNVFSSQVAIAHQGGKIWLVSNCYSQTGSGNGLLVWDVTNGPSSLGATPTVFLKGPNAGFTCGADDTVGPNSAGLIWLASLSGFQGYQYS